jgi:hypothetical protein
VRIALALGRRPDDAGENLLTVGASPGTISATDLACHDRGPDRVFGAPVRRVDRRIKQEGPDGHEFALEVRGETLDVRHATGAFKAFGEAGDELPPDDSQSMRGDDTGVVAVADVERLLQDYLYVHGEGGVRVIGGDQPTPAQEMGETGLMSGGRELPVRCPAIAHQDAGKVRTEHRGGFLEAATGLNAIDRRVRRRKGPQPLQSSRDFPAGFIGTDHRTATGPCTQRVIRWSRLARRAMDGVHQAATRHGQPIELLQQGRDLAERQPELFVEDHHQRDHLRPELGRRSANRIRRLQRMATLDTPTASVAPADVQIKLPDDDARDGQLFLVLRGDGRFDDRTGAGRTLRRERHVVALVDLGRHPSTGFGTVRATRLPSRTFRLRFQRFGEGGGLPESRPARVIELPFEMINLLTEALIFSAQSIALALRLLRSPAPVGIIRSIVRVVGLRPLRHAAVMPEFTAEYKTR